MLFYKFILINFTKGFLLKHQGSDNYLGLEEDNITLTNSASKALDIKMLDTRVSPLASVLTTGAMAISGKNDKIQLKTLNRDDSNQHFLFILNPSGSIILQNGDKCIGTKKISGGTVIGKINCNKYNDLLKFIRTDFLNEELDRVVPSGFHRHLSSDRELTVRLTPSSAETGYIGGVPLHPF